MTFFDGWTNAQLLGLLIASPFIVILIWCGYWFLMALFDPGHDDWKGPGDE